VYLWIGRTWLCEFASGGEEGWVGSEPEADIDSTGNEVVRGLERS
jgi:hypothetical protein